MRLILLGAPGVGKGTQAKLISKFLNIPHISTGDIFRTHIQNGTALGRQAKSYMGKGELVPDELTISIVKERLSMEDCGNGFLLDGFPRNLVQAKELDAFLHSKKQSIDKAVLITLPKEVIIERTSGRRFCTKCGSSFHITYNPSKLGLRCENCGQPLIQRSDDKQEVVLDRLKTYYKTIDPLLDYYCAHRKLYSVQGGDSINEVFNEVCTTLKAV